jgi:hypothetical protein
VVQLSRPRWRVAAIAASVLAGLVAIPVAPAAAGPDNGDHPLPQIVATGLNNPRHVRWSGGALYVAEAGKGGPGPCIPGGEGPEAPPNCYGTSGSITRVSYRHQTRVVKGLPSLAATGGENALGPADMRVHGRNFVVALGLGAAPALRDQLPGKGHKLGTVSVGRFGHQGLRVLADIAGYEASANPDGAQLDSNPVALLESRRGLFVVDAGGNSLLKVKRPGQVRTVAVFPATDVPAPPFLGLPPGTMIPMDAVPTAAAIGPDGAIYVSQLTGFPFPVGEASIWRVVPGHAPTKYVTGLTNVTDLAFGKDGSLYVVQIADTGLLDPSPRGSVVRIPARGGAPKAVVSGLKTPYGITLHGHSAYVSVCSTCPGDGEVIRVPLGGAA